MFSLLLLLIFAGVVAAFWFQGLWTCAIGVINMLLAGFIATNYYEPLSAFIETKAPDYTYLIDFLVIWGLFGFSYSLLRAIADGISKQRLEFHKYVELGGRSVLALWAGWIFLCFTAFTLHMAPLPPSPLGAWQTPDSSTFLFLSPDRQWLSLMQSRSRGALSRGKIAGATSPVHPDDQAINVETFDPNGDFTFKFHDRRDKYWKLEAMRAGP